MIEPWAHWAARGADLVSFMTVGVPVLNQPLKLNTPPQRCVQSPQSYVTSPIAEATALFPAQFPPIHSATTLLPEKAFFGSSHCRKITR